MFFEKSVKVAAADVEVVCDICHCDIQKRTFFDVIHSLGNVKIIVGFHGGVGSMKFFLQHGDDSVKTALDISFVGRRQLGMGHHFTDRFRIGNYRSKLLNRIFLEELLGRLPAKERQLIYMRYFQDMTQAQIAGKLGISQVQVSRMEKKILRQMRMEKV
mgnify:CR=1 FL=1